MLVRPPESPALAGAAGAVAAGAALAPFDFAGAAAAVVAVAAGWAGGGDATTTGGFDTTGRDDAVVVGEAETMVAAGFAGGAGATLALVTMLPAGTAGDAVTDASAGAASSATLGV